LQSRQFRKPTTGALSALGLGSSRLMDYLQTDPQSTRTTSRRGHSRFGKTALVAMAYEPRFTVAYINSSGAAAHPSPAAVRRAA